MRVAPGHLGGQPHPLQHAAGGRLAVARGLQAVGDLRADPPPGVEGGVGVLEDHLDLGQRPVPAAQAKGGHLPALERDRPAGGGGEPADRPRQRGLAAARLADQADDLAGRHAQAGPRHRPYGRTARRPVVDDQVVHGQQAHEPSLGSASRRARV